MAPGAAVYLLSLLLEALQGPLSSARQGRTVLRGFSSLHISVNRAA